MKGKNIPEVRFSVSSEEWAEYKISDVADMYDNLRVPVKASKRTKGDVPYYGANGIQDYVEGFTHEGEFVLLAEDGANDLINYPVNYVQGKVWVNNHAHVLSGRKYILDNLFLTTRIKSMNISSYLVGGGRAKLNGEILKKIPITIPSFEEQRKIGDFFKYLDETINLAQQELNNIKQTKQGFLQKLFPKEGTSVPEVRFYGFNGIWEEVLLGEKVEISTGKLDANAMVDGGLYPFFTCAKETYATNTYSFDGESLLIAGNGEIGLVKYYDGKFDAYQRTYVLTNIQTNAKYLEYFLNVALPERIHVMTHGSTMPYITLSVLKDMFIKLPSIEEQQKIGEFFEKLDKTIELQQRELALLKETKKAFLQKLFI